MHSTLVVHAIFTSPLRKLRPSRRPPAQSGERLIIVGNGMVSSKLCEYLVRAGLNKTLRITIVGEESHPAYDRIRLSEYTLHQNPSELLLHDRDWYEDQNLTLITGIRVTALERELNSIHLSTGRRLNYDHLVLVTGARPFTPPIPGINSKGVLLYRTIDDLKKLVESARGHKRVAVVGGGLLGLEAAQASMNLGLEPTVLEQAEYLMPRQLNQRASSLLESYLRDLGIHLRLGASLKAIQRENEELLLDLGDGEHIKTDLVVISAGIVPNSELAEEAGLPTGLRGGVIVDEHLQSEDPKIFAIGECALLNGKTYGLASPGYEMAKHVAQRLAGKRVYPLAEPDTSTRLKMLGVDVTVVGDPLEEGRQVQFSSDRSYRMMILGPNGKLRGALGVGPWPEAGQLQSLLYAKARMRKKEEASFLQGGTLSPQDSNSSITQWPNDRIVCNCLRIPKDAITKAMSQVGSDADEVADHTGASTVCGSCRPLVEELCGASSIRTKPKSVRLLFGISLGALLAALITILTPPPAMADSVLSWWYQVDQFWRDGRIKQISGFSLLGVCLVGLTFSLRKRIPWLRLGQFAYWRVFHTAFGFLALIGLFVHTGFRFGHNLNFWLMFTFVGLNLLGAIAGIVAALEGSGTSRKALIARRLRPLLSYAHLILFWPLPVLLTFHILTVYLY